MLKKSWYDLQSPMGDSFIPGLSLWQAALVIFGSLVLVGMVKETKIGKRVVIPFLIAVGIILFIYVAAAGRMPVNSAGELAGIVAFSGLVGFVVGFVVGYSANKKP